MTIITSDWLIANSQEEPLRSHGIRVQSTQITEIGDNHELKAKYPEDELIDGTGKILLPGFVNAHTHMYGVCLLYTSPSPRDAHESRMPSSA